MKTLILTDNPWARALGDELAAKYGDIELFQSPNGVLQELPRVNVRTQVSMIADLYGLVISIHCKQLFPADLVARVRCVNVHPGFNPFNRGYYPQVFSIVNGMKAGVTIHEIDEQLDHGRIIVQQEYRIKPWNTSESAYVEIMKIERDLLLRHFPAIRDRTYQASDPAGEGNINYKRDFESLRRIDLDQEGSFREFLNRLRALTHGDFNNAYFIDEAGNRIFVRVELKPEGIP